MTAESRTDWLGTRGVCRAQPLQHAHTVTLRGLQFKAEGKEALTER